MGKNVGLCLYIFFLVVSSGHYFIKNLKSSDFNNERLFVEGAQDILLLCFIQSFRMGRTLVKLSILVKALTKIVMMNVAIFALGD